MPTWTRVIVWFVVTGWVDLVRAGEYTTGLNNKGASEVIVNNVRVWRAPDHTRLVFDLSAPIDYQLFTCCAAPKQQAVTKTSSNTGHAKHNRVVIDIQQAQFSADLAQLALSGTPIKQIRFNQGKNNTLRLVLDLSEAVTPKDFVLKPAQPYGDRLVVDLFDQLENDATPPLTNSTVEPSKPASVFTNVQSVVRADQDVVIAIDPGHGGDDPGAIGPSRVYEKNVVLAIAKALYAELEEIKGFRPVLIRDGDYYVSLRQRIKLAREKGADLFVSIHADAFKNDKAQGASVYTLSAKGATSETARWLAEQENETDLIGGVGLNDKDDLLKGVLLDLSMTAKIQSSLLVGNTVLRSLSNTAYMHRRTVDSASFIVLKSPDIPSILIETGFISNPKEERALSSRRHQKKLARAIRQGIVTYFQTYPVPGTYLANNSVVEYKINRGDTLSDIALRFQVNLASIRAFNDLKNDIIQVGQVLRIPRS